MLNKNAKKHFSEYLNVDLSEPLKKHSHKKNPDKLLVISDPHCPFEHKDYFIKSINDNTDCKNIFINGDFFDNYSRSHYRRSQDIDFRWEFRLAYLRLKEVADNFDGVYIMLANHDMRWLKYLMDNVPNDCLDFLNKNLFEDLIKTIPNVRIVKQLVGDRKVSHLFQYKDVIFTHEERSSVDIAKVVQEVAKQYYKWGEHYNLKPYRAIIQGHNHVSAKIRFGDRFLYQIPCLINSSDVAFDYVYNGRTQGNPPALGYMMAYFDNDKFNPNKSYIYDYGV